VLVGALGPIDVAVMGGHLWGFDGDFSTSIVQPMLYYNIESIPGAYLAYNNTASYDHKTKDGNGNSWTIPLGLDMASISASVATTCRAGAGARAVQNTR
jgi:hypothetical protein